MGPRRSDPREKPDAADHSHLLILNSVSGIDAHSSSVAFSMLLKVSLKGLRSDVLPGVTSDRPSASHNGRKRGVITLIESVCGRRFKARHQAPVSKIK